MNTGLRCMHVFKTRGLHKGFKNVLCRLCPTGLNNIRLCSKLPVDKDEELKSLLKEIQSDFADSSQSEAIVDEGDMVIHQRMSGSTEPTEQEVYDDYFLLEQEDLESQEISEKSIPISLSRGSTGVFDLEELMTVLREENAQDVVVLDVPAEYNYVQYMVVASGRSRRHLRAMAEWINKLYKRKMSTSDSYMSISNKADTEWISMDLGNIALQLFMPDKRAYYNLEGLWSGEDTQEVRDVPLTPLDEIWSRVQAWQTQADSISACSRSPVIAETEEGKLENQADKAVSSGDERTEVLEKSTEVRGKEMDSEKWGFR